jgi:hypothetical protein
MATREGTTGRRAMPAEGARSRLLASVETKYLGGEDPVGRDDR